MHNTENTIPFTHYLIINNISHKLEENNTLSEMSMWVFNMGLLAHTYETTGQVFHKHQYYKQPILEFLNWILAWPSVFLNWEKISDMPYSRSFCPLPPFTSSSPWKRKSFENIKNPQYNGIIAMVFKCSGWNTHCGCQNPPTPTNICLSTSSSRCFCFCVCQPSLTLPGACGLQISHISQQLGDIPQIQPPSP